jgi:flagellar biosynthesis/type III secretory pathway chaperone
MSKPAQSDVRERLYRLLGESLNSAKLLRSRLIDERTALEKQDESTLASNAAQKDQMVRTLASLEKARGEIGRDAGFGAGLENMGELTDWCDRNEMIACRWQEFRALVQQCNTMNSTNGAIITARRQQVLAGLALLRGHEAAADTYGVPGARLRAMGGRELAEA